MIDKFVPIIKPITNSLLFGGGYIIESNFSISLIKTGKEL